MRIRSTPTLAPLLLLAACISRPEPERAPARAPARPFEEVWAEQVRATAPEAPDTPPTAEPATGEAGGENVEPTAPEVANTVVSAGGTFLVAWVSDPAPIPDNEPFEMVVSVLDASTGKLLGDVELEVDAGMPQHGHGMNRQPRVERTGDSRTFRVSGMLFHMIGDWELYFDVTRGALTERAQVGVTLE